MAAISVVLFHYTTRYRELFGVPTPLPFEFGFGFYGVHLFFVISGFVISMTIQRSKTATEFVVSRFSRLYPVFWVSVIITFVVCKLFPLKGMDHSLWEFAANLTMFNGFLKIPYVDGVYWSLTYELGFYIAILGIFKMGKLRHLEAPCWFWMCAPVWFHYWSGLIPHPLHFITVIHSYGHLFAAGIVLFRIHSKGLTSARLSLLFAAAFAQFLTTGWSDTIAVVVCIVLVGAALRGFLDPLCTRPLLWLGAISYPLYLIHENVGWSILIRLYAYGLTPIQAVSTTVALAVLLASALHVLVEDPAMNAIRRKFSYRIGQSVGLPA